MKEDNQYQDFNNKYFWQNIYYINRKNIGLHIHRRSFLKIFSTGYELLQTRKKQQFICIRLRSSLMRQRSHTNVKLMIFFINLHVFYLFIFLRRIFEINVQLDSFVVFRFSLQLQSADSSNSGNTHLIQGFHASKIFSVQISVIFNGEKIQVKHTNFRFH